MEYFSHFAWPIPSAFSDALGTCTFSSGDVFYSDLDAYQAWDEAFYSKQTPFYELRIMGSFSYSNTTAEPQPPTTNPVSPEKKKKTLTAFEKNWKRTLEIELRIHRGNSEPVRLVTTQGAIYMTLWKGDVAILTNPTPIPIPSFHNDMFAIGLPSDKPCQS
ncbi:MAG: hypothetical protein AAB276_00780 [Pseudomonadota bacterium]